MGKEVKEGKSFEKEQAKSKESIEQLIKNLLIVEDTPENIEGAKEFFEDDEIKMNVDYAQDYKTAEKLLEENKYDGVITDLFFPNDINNPEDIELAKKTIEQMDKKFNETPRRTPASEPIMTWINGREESRGQIFKPGKLIQEELPENPLPQISRLADEQPLGVNVVQLAKNKEIPYTVLTREGHGAWKSVAAYLVFEGFVKDKKEGNVELIGVPYYTKSAKSWEGAFNRLVDIVKSEQSKAEKE